MLGIKSYTYLYGILHSLRGILAKHGLAAAANPVSAIDGAKSGDFVICPDLDLTFDLLKQMFKIPLKSARRGVSITASPTPLLTLVCELSRGRVICPTPVRRVRLETPHCAG